MQSEVEYYVPTQADALPLSAMAREAFADTFAHLYDPGPFSEFLDAAYGPEGRIANDLRDPAVRWLAASDGSGPVAYAKLSPLRAPAPAPKPGAVELQQIYVLRPWQGRGVGERLMEWALATAQDLEAPEIYLTVFDHNARAKRFYTRHGFAEVGRCTFTLGDRVDDDRVWRKPLSGRAAADRQAIS